MQYKVAPGRQLPVQVFSWKTNMTTPFSLQEPIEMIYDSESDADANESECKDSDRHNSNDNDHCILH